MVVFLRFLQYHLKRGGQSVESLTHGDATSGLQLPEADGEPPALLA